MLVVPPEPLPITFAASRNEHRFLRMSPSMASLEPGNGNLIFGLVLLSMTPLVVAICWHYHLPRALMIFLPLIPVLGGVIHIVFQFIYAKFGTRINFDQSTAVATVTGVRHGGKIQLPFNNIRAVQFCEFKIKGSEIGPVTQLNLIIEDPSVRRINLLQNGGRKKLHRIAGQIAEYLGVPVYRGSEIVPPGELMV
jgi:hypothetical protein